MNKLAVILIIGISLSLASCISARYGKKSVPLVEAVPDFHIYEDVTYPDSPFQDLMTKASSNNTHYVNVLNIGDEALLARIHLIRAAQKAIYIQTFIWANDETGRYMYFELLEAAKRGVEVKIILDGLDYVKNPELIAFAATAHPNIEIKHYNPFANSIAPSKLQLIRDAAGSFTRINQRMHNKAFIVDDRIGITGGRNYQNDYYDRSPQRNFIDRDVLVVGSLVREMTDSFMHYWAFNLSIPSHDLLDVHALIQNENYEKYVGRESFFLGRLFDDLDRQASDVKYIQETLVNKAYNVRDIAFVADLPGKNKERGLKGGGVTTDALMKFLSLAEYSIVAQTPYLVLDKEMIKFYKNLRKKRESFDILFSTNGFESTDNLYAYAFSYKYKKRYLKKCKFRIFEMKRVPDDHEKRIPPLEHVSRGDEWTACVHAKTFVIDNDAVWIGSFNVDPRSVNLNTEMGVIVYDEAVAQAVQANILRDIEPHNSWTIGKRQKVPFVSFFSGFMANLSGLMKFMDVWPFQYSASFTLKEGKEVVPFYHEDFYDNYSSVGAYQGVQISERKMKIRMIKAFGGGVEPII